MTDDEFLDLFAQVRWFDWDDDKCERNFRVHGFDFNDSRHAFDEPVIARRSDRKNEVRYMVFGFLDDVEIVIVCTIRGDVCRIISTRRARRDERKKYHSRLARRSAEGQD